MQFRLAQSEERAAVLGFYASVIAKTENLPRYARWQAGVYPTEQGLTDYLRARSICSARERRLRRPPP